jgi:tagatose kinase
MPSPAIISMGNMLVEIMRRELDQPLNAPGTFAGPYPSGDTPIYIDTVARLGGSAGFIGAVGQDDFGHCLLDRFARDGVDFSCGRVLTDYTTGAAFVAYFHDGSRKFIFHSRHAAAGQLAPEQVEPAYMRAAQWLHLTGCNLALSPSAQAACYRALELLPPQARLSFDPNIRPELLSADAIRALCGPVLERADLILPSLSEAAMLTGAADDEAGCRQWAAAGKLVVLKLGPGGCRIYQQGNAWDIPGFRVDEVDPTGAGDSFCAGLTMALLEGQSLLDAGRFANAAGALAVTQKGPMEGAPTRAQVLKLIESQGVKP